MRRKQQSYLEAHGSSVGQQQQQTLRITKNLESYASEISRSDSGSAAQMVSF